MAPPARRPGRWRPCSRGRRATWSACLRSVPPPSCATPPCCPRPTPPPPRHLDRPGPANRLAGSACRRGEGLALRAGAAAAVAGFVMALAAVGEDLVLGLLFAHASLHGPSPARYRERSVYSKRNLWDR